MSSGMFMGTIVGKFFFNSRMGGRTRKAYSSSKEFDASGKILYRVDDSYYMIEFIKYSPVGHASWESMLNKSKVLVNIKEMVTGHPWLFFDTFEELKDFECYTDYAELSSKGKKVGRRIQHDDDEGEDIDD